MCATWEGSPGWLLCISPQMFKALPTHNEKHLLNEWMYEWMHEWVSESVKVEVVLCASVLFPLYFHSANVFWAPTLCKALSPHDSLALSRVALPGCGLWPQLHDPGSRIWGQALGCLPTQSPSLIPAGAAAAPVEPLAWCWQSHKEKRIILSSVT